jgi:photosystem II stability/assembly factor-like uncharacterized protein
MVRRLLVALFLCFSSAFSQGFHSIHTTNGIDVWAVGKNGSVFRSFNGGVTWGTYPHGTATWRSVFALNTMVWMVGDNGAFRYSTNSGETWQTQTLAAGQVLHAVRFSDEMTGWVVGENGTVLKSIDGGATWESKPSGVSLKLQHVAVANPTTIYVAGAAGTLLKSGDAGESWSPVSRPEWARDFRSVDVSGEMVYAVGDRGTAYKSTDGGQSWTTLNFRTDSGSDLHAVAIVNEEKVFFAFGGGAIRFTANGDRSYDWGLHGMHASLSDIYFHDAMRGWACSDRNNAVMRTTDGGATWHLPQGTTVNHSWSQRLSGSNSTGNTFAINPWNPKLIYVALGRFIYMSADFGETWTQTAVISSTSGASRSFYISPKDTNVYVVAYTGGGHRIMRSTDRGQSWVTTIAQTFTSYGMPLEMNPDKPDTLIFAPDATPSATAANAILYRSTNFGTTWDTLAQTNFRSPCDVVIVPDSNNIMYVGDGITGNGQAQLWRSTNGGLTWTSIFATSGSEIPMISVSRMRNTDAYATAWGSGGVRKTKDLGADWTSVATTGSTWGTDMAKDDPNVVLYGVYGGGTSYLSTNAGISFTSTPLSGSNSAMLCYDRGTFLAQQTSGVSKYSITYTVPTNNAQTIALVAPNGGESWQYGTTQMIRWNANNISNVKIEFRENPAADWETVVGSTPASMGEYAWVVPNTPTSEGRIRIGNSATGTPVVTSAGTFSIGAAGISGLPSRLDFGWVRPGHDSTIVVEISNPGTYTLVIQSISTVTPYFMPGRTSFSVPASGSDTLSITFAPLAVEDYVDTLRLVTNAPGTDLRVVLFGAGDPTTSIAEGGVIPQEYLLKQNFPNPFNPATTITFGLPEAGHTSLVIFNSVGQEVATLLDGMLSAGYHTVRFPVEAASGAPVSSGIYFYQLRSGSFIETRKMMLLK